MVEVRDAGVTRTQSCAYGEQNRAFEAENNGFDEKKWAPCWFFEKRFLSLSSRFNDYRPARMAESVDALVSNTNVSNDVPVRPRLRVPEERNESFSLFLFCSFRGEEHNVLECDVSAH